MDYEMLKDMFIIGCFVFPVVNVSIMCYINAITSDLYAQSNIGHMTMVSCLSLVPAVGVLMFIVCIFMLVSTTGIFSYKPFVKD